MKKKYQPQTQSKLRESVSESNNKIVKKISFRKKKKSMNSKNTLSFPQEVIKETMHENLIKKIEDEQSKLNDGIKDLKKSLDVLNKSHWKAVKQFKEIKAIDEEKKQKKELIKDIDKSLNNINKTLEKIKNIDFDYTHIGGSELSRMMSKIKKRRIDNQIIYINSKININKFLN